jgi:uncharacterized membrane protein YkvA (DUF1232 family)
MPQSSPCFAMAINLVVHAFSPINRVADFIAVPGLLDDTLLPLFGIRYTLKPART